ncbi:MAG TPA: hypothetical protein H9844_10860 [Candidatus Evtepia faecigallinarum]|nr:hypothetical protein [Candidatus Evtepia faecigallinarum]
MTTPKQKKYHILSAFCLLTALLLLAACGDNASSASGTIVGSYTSGAGDAQVTFAVDQDNQVYYADQKNDCYIHGQVQQKEGEVYFLSCQDSVYKDRIPDQEFTLDGKTISLTIQGEVLQFEKIDDHPSLIGDVECYL